MKCSFNSSVTRSWWLFGVITLSEMTLQLFCLKPTLTRVTVPTTFNYYVLNNFQISQSR